jgi:hypothetical protein
MVDIVPCSAPLKTKITAFTLTVGQASGLPTGQAGGLSYAESKNCDASFTAIALCRLGDFTQGIPFGGTDEKNVVGNGAEHCALVESGG